MKQLIKEITIVIVAVIVVIIWTIIVAIAPYIKIKEK